MVCLVQQFASRRPVGTPYRLVPNLKKNGTNLWVTVLARPSPARQDKA